VLSVEFTNGAAEGFTCRCTTGVTSQTAFLQNFGEPHTIDWFSFVYGDVFFADYNLFLTLPAGVTLAATPLPAALPLFATGLCALGLFVSRRNRMRSAIARC
jgi:hypothetical protein